MVFLKKVLESIEFMIKRKTMFLMNKRGFTLIELIVVIVIIGVLAAIAAPMMQGNVARAKKSEAVAALGAIRTAERCYYVDSGGYVAVASTGWGSTGSLNQYVRSQDLDGRYYSNGNYIVNGGNMGSSFLARAVNSTLGEVTLDQAGNLNFEVY